MNLADVFDVLRRTDIDTLRLVEVEVHRLVVERLTLEPQRSSTLREENALARRNG